ncbi:MAG: 16S rRNA (guanine(527)-N(7))-methyltransferase RsmG [Proteobacteria bacterium]|nr:16S rRNA (guanine(527)-N(7))-methyltransferase RsmG [Pseudomonadota bacterium]
MSNWEIALSDGAAQLGVQLASTQHDILCNYLQLIKKWSKHYNLTSTDDPRELVLLHIVDSLAVVPHLPTHTARLLDVGSGAGLPGVPIAVLRPDIQVTALEPVNKKYAFLATVKRELTLPNFLPIANRLEHHKDDPLFSPYDVAVSRATFSLDRWLALGRDVVSPDGLVIGMEGRTQVALPRGVKRHSYELRSNPPRTRSIVSMHRQ